MIFKFLSFSPKNSVNLVIFFIFQKILVEVTYFDHGTSSTSCHISGHFEKGKFSLYFLSSFVDDVDIDNLSDSERYELMKTQFHPVLELTQFGSHFCSVSNSSFNLHFESVVFLIL